MFLINIILKKIRTFNQDNRIPLHYAVIFHSKEMEDLLIAEGADIEAKDIIYQIILKLYLIKAI